MNKRKGPSRRFRFFLIQSAVVVLFLGVCGRLVYVQGVLRSELSEKASRQLPDKEAVPVLRNAILDRNGVPLAETVQVYSCFIDPYLIDNPSQVISVLTSVLGVSRAELEKEMARTSNRFSWVKRDISSRAVSEIRSRNLKGVGFKLESRRHFPQGVLSSHLIGLVGLDGRGLSGIEQKYDKVLRGQADLKSNGKIPAGHVQLTIDGWIQQIVEKELDWASRKTGAKKGLVIAQDVETGEILAMASWPFLSLDPDSPPPSKELFIPAISDVFEPGSTFKVVTAAAALEEGVIEENEIFDGEDGAYPVADIVINDHHALGKMTFEDVFINSSNIGTAKIAEKLGSERLYQYARQFGFGVFPGCDLPGETKGVLRPPSRWSGVSKHVVSFGQEIGVNSVQMVGAYSAIANGGRLMEPIIVKSVQSKNQKILWEAKPTPIRQVVSKDVAFEVKRILAQVVEKGTGQNAQLKYAPHVKVAGKTGTAQKFDSELGRYSDQKTLVSFSGFFPVEKPKISIFVMLDEPEGIRWGGVDAAPLFRRIADQITSHIFL